MPELRSYLRHQLPPVLAAQVRAFQRIQWPFLDQRSDLLWDFAARPDAPAHFVIAEGEVLISHACVNRRRIEVQNQPLEVFGLSSVFTYPAWRGEGYAGQVVDAATDYLRASPADMAMLFCGEPLEKFYAQRGWSAAREAHILFGTRDSPQRKHDNRVMMLFVSETGRALRRTLETTPVYVGNSTW
jgi:predicted N-acetyltransferase YhbS